MSSEADESLVSEAAKELARRLTVPCVNHTHDAHGTPKFACGECCANTAMIPSPREWLENQLDGFFARRLRDLAEQVQDSAKRRRVELHEW